MIDGLFVIPPFHLEQRNNIYVYQLPLKGLKIHRFLLTVYQAMFNWNGSNKIEETDCSRSYPSIRLKTEEMQVGLKGKFIYARAAHELKAHTAIDTGARSSRTHRKMALLCRDVVISFHSSPPAPDTHCIYLCRPCKTPSHKARMTHTGERTALTKSQSQSHPCSTTDQSTWLSPFSAPIFGNAYSRSLSSGYAELSSSLSS